MKKYLLILLTLFLYTCEEDPAAPIEGCMDESACNYNENAATDGDCVFLFDLGWSDRCAANTWCGFSYH